VIQHLAPGGRDGVGGVAQDVQQADAIEPEPWHERKLDEPFTRDRQRLSVLIVVSNNRQTLTRRYIYRHNIGDRKPGDFAFVLMFEPDDIQLAAALIDFAFAVKGSAHAIVGESLLRLFLLL